MNPEWRTSQVVSLCQMMLDQRDYALLPILADALEDAGCTDDKLIASCREDKGTIGSLKDINDWKIYECLIRRFEIEGLVNQIYSEKTEKAVKYIGEVGKEISYEYDDEPPMYSYASMIYAGHRAIKNGEYCWGTDAGSEFFYNDDNREKFFKNWSLLTGVPVSDEKRDDIGFRCAC
ncbi:hypothetical protein C4565_00635 [Candidatus Parcubacteria bacterium]|nr:MAG: hypothetical protein C4565_00635 [Candidatus Parcubacteria bacterium]